MNLPRIALKMQTHPTNIWAGVDTVCDIDIELIALSMDIQLIVLVITQSSAI